MFPQRVLGIVRTKCSHRDVASSCRGLLSRNFGHCPRIRRLSVSYTRHNGTCREINCDSIFQLSGSPIILPVEVWCTLTHLSRNLSHSRRAVRLPLTLTLTSWQRLITIVSTRTVADKLSNRSPLNIALSCATRGCWATVRGVVCTRWFLSTTGRLNVQ